MWLLFKLHSFQTDNRDGTFHFSKLQFLKDWSYLGTTFSVLYDSLLCRSINILVWGKGCSNVRYDKKICSTKCWYKMFGPRNYTKNVQENISVEIR